MPPNDALHRSASIGKRRGEPSLPREAPHAEYPRPDEATSDISCRCYLRGPDGVRKLPPFGTWDTLNLIRESPSDNERVHRTAAAQATIAARTTDPA